MAYFVYLLQLKNHQIYVGSTDNLTRRIAEHRNGQGGRTTSIGKVLHLMYSETYASRSEAEARELQLKRWTRAKKLALARGDRSDLFLRSKRKPEQLRLKASPRKMSEV